MFFISLIISFFDVLTNLWVSVWTLLEFEDHHCAADLDTKGGFGMYLGHAFAQYECSKLGAAIKELKLTFII